MTCIFLDVGANTGQTLAAALVRPEFDRIVCFEPAPQCWGYLHKMADARTTIETFGLWDRTAHAELFEAGRKGGGMFRKDKWDRDVKSQLCRFMRASEWMRENTIEKDEIWMKLNCEGAECDILDDILDAGLFDRIKRLMVDFDVRKIAAHKHREAELRARLAPYSFPRVAYCRDVMIGDTHADRIHHWLDCVRVAA